MHHYVRAIERHTHNTSTRLESLADRQNAPTKEGRGGKRREERQPRVSEMERRVQGSEAGLGRGERGKIKRAREMTMSVKKREWREEEIRGQKLERGRIQEARRETGGESRDSIQTRRGYEITKRAKWLVVHATSCCCSEPLLENPRALCPCTCTAAIVVCFRKLFSL